MVRFPPFYSVIALASAAVLLACAGKVQSSELSAASYCDDVAAYASRCAASASSDPCFSSEVASCTHLASVASSMTLAARDSCFRELTCGDDAGSAGSSCFQVFPSNAIPTAAQAQLAQDYCRRCGLPGDPGATSSCEALFYLPLNTGGSCMSDLDCIGDVPGSCQRGACNYYDDPGPGASLLEFSDAIAEFVDVHCALPQEGNEALCGNFAGCESMALAAAIPSAPACEPPDGG